MKFFDPSGSHYKQAEYIPAKIVKVEDALQKGTITTKGSSVFGTGFPAWNNNKYQAWHKTPHTEM